MARRVHQTGIPAEAFNRVADRGERIAIKRDDGKSVVLISEEDAKLLESLEDRYWGEKAEQVLDEMKTKNLKPVPLEAIRKRLKT